LKPKPEFTPFLFSTNATEQTNSSVLWRWYVRCTSRCNILFFLGVHQSKKKKKIYTNSTFTQLL